LHKRPKRDPQRADGVAVEKRRGRGPVFFQPTGKPAYFSGLFSVSEQLNLELLAVFVIFRLRGRRLYRGRIFQYKHLK
jgi:hypothetical protein